MLVILIAVMYYNRVVYLNKDMTYISFMENQMVSNNILTYEEPETNNRIVCKTMQNLLNSPLALLDLVSSFKTSFIGQ